jgi:thiol:disulfide interchange protein
MAEIAILVVSEFVSVVLASILVYFFIKAHRLVGAIYLFGLPIGFSFLASSYFFLGMSLLYENDATISNSFLWLRLITQSFGFAFIAFSYYFSSKTERTTKYFLGLITFSSAISILLVFVALVAAPPFLEIPSVNVLDEYFRITNLVFLGYVIYHLVKHVKPSNETISGLVWSPTAFSLMWLAQYSLLIWGIDGSQAAFILAHVARLGSLTLFILIYCQSGGARE